MRRRVVAQMAGSPEPRREGGLHADRLMHDPAVAGPLAEIFRRNTLGEDGFKRTPDDAEVMACVRAMLDGLLDPDGVGLADVGGLRFILERGSDLYPGPDVIHASAWDDGQWRPIARVLLSESAGTPGAASGDGSGSPSGGAASGGGTSGGKARGA